MWGVGDTDFFRHPLRLRGKVTFRGLVHCMAAKVCYVFFEVTEWPCSFRRIFRAWDQSSLPARTSSMSAIHVAASAHT